MATLSAFQRVDRVLPGMPFGSGSAGSTSVSASPSRATVTGTATTTSSTLGSAILSNGDIALLHQTRGTGAGQWEINRVSSGGGTTSITWQTALQYTYGTGAQVVKLTQYNALTINNYTPTAWDGTTGGLDVWLAKSITVSGAIAGTGKGFRGGPAGEDNPSGYAAAFGESTAGYPGTEATGAGINVTNDPSGGGYGTAGTTNNSAGGGDAHGSADLTAFDFGGGGAGATANPSSNAGNGGASGCAIVLIADTITLSANVTANGGAGSFGNDRGGAGGSGGAVLMVCRTGSLGTNSATATGGAGANNNNSGITGGVGRIAVHHSGSVTGTTNPTFTDVSDATLVESLGGSFIFNLL